MTETVISLISILIGILGAHSAGFVFKKYSFGIIGNTIAGVFGSILLIKAFGRFGFDPSSIVHPREFNISLFFINVIVSFLGGSFAVLLIAMLKNKLNTNQD